ncbi:uncharacterized protein BKCO1_16000108 [Diplodia corticola]|uniref:Uncharacterized protein n=1 Tax=Diplodia corticola TaxID=236234 RepID=A0A1J9R515_9PEZI|nr:uncharacterized protein BKCO1_16000108 [Diplodia corticola]OJD35688.1 hypothetical protein BKCO1_16000108 [Diplodia corticola]
MVTANPLQLPHSARQSLLTGPTITLALPLPSINTTYTIPSLPRRLLFAFSHLAATQLTVADAAPTTPSSRLPSPPRTITLPPSSCTPAALELLIQHLKQCCRRHHHHPDTSPPPPLPPTSTWRQAIHLYAAARALRVIPAVATPLRRRIEARLDPANATTTSSPPPSAAELADAVTALMAGRSSSSMTGDDCDDGNDSHDDRLVKEIVKKTAAWARATPGVGGMEVERERMKAWLAASAWPRLVAWWDECDERAVAGRRLDVGWVRRVKSLSSSVLGTAVEGGDGGGDEVEGRKKEEEGRREELRRRLDGLGQRLREQRSVVGLRR